MKRQKNEKNLFFWVRKFENFCQKPPKSQKNKNVNSNKTYVKKGLHDPKRILDAVILGHF